MRPISYLSVFILAIVLVGTSCKKKEEISEVNNTLIFSSLSADPPTVPYNKSVTLTATATGESITYLWSLNGTGTMVGTGSVITYQPCCAGQNEIVCKVKDVGNNELEKAITINVTN